MKGDTIIIKGARENNLKDISLEIPKHQITVFTGAGDSQASDHGFHGRIGLRQEFART